MPRGWRTLDAGRCCRLRGCNVRSLPVRPQHLNFKALTNFLFLRARAGCRRLWSCRAARGLYGRVARQHTLTLGLWDVCAPLSSVRGGRPDSGPLEACFVGGDPDGGGGREWSKYTCGESRKELHKHTHRDDDEVDGWTGWAAGQGAISICPSLTQTSDLTTTVKPKWEGERGKGGEGS